MYEETIRRFKEGDVILGVVGMGYVGLPLAVEAAEAGVKTLGFDVKEDVVRKLNEGVSHIQDVPSEAVRTLRDRDLLEATADMARLAECDVISICVPTPLSKTRDPDVSYILKATEAVAGGLQAGQLIVLESTTYPGTTREVVQPTLEAGGLKAGRDFFLCFSPERVDPGNEVWQTKNTPKLLGGVTPACTAAGMAFYERFIDTVVPLTSAEAAELAKILENTFRAVNIALVNEVAQMADRLGVDVWEVIEAAATKPFGFMKFTPGPGLGGHCIPVDPHYLSWKMRTLDYRTRFIELASEINAEMPTFVVGKVRQALNTVSKPVRGSRVVILGVAYKKDIDDIRESPALDILRFLRADGADVVFHDPLIPTFHEDGEEWVSEPWSRELLTQADAVVIVTDHSSYDFKEILELSPILVDTRNATARIVKELEAAARESGDGALSEPLYPKRWIVKGA